LYSSCHTVSRPHWQLCNSKWGKQGVLMALALVLILVHAIPEFSCSLRIIMMIQASVPNRDFT